MRSSIEIHLTTVRIAAAVCAFALGGCIETRFESPIGDNIETCDSGWKGLWVDGPDAVFYVNDACELIVLDPPEKPGPLKQIHVPVNYVHAGGKDYVVIADTAVKGLADVKPPHGITPVPEKSYFFARYKLRGDRLEMYQVDSERTAKLVVDGKLDGTLDKTQNELHVYVRGTRAKMLEMVRTQPIFDDKPVELTRSKQTLDEYDKSQAADVSAGKAR